MAQEKAGIGGIAASQYAGSFNYRRVTGTFTTDAGRRVQSVSGSDPDLGDFDAYGDGASSFNLRPRDIGRAQDLAALAQEAVSAIKEALPEALPDDATEPETETGQAEGRNLPS